MWGRGGGINHLQQDLTKLSDWAAKWQMNFNPTKCSSDEEERANFVTVHYVMMGQMLQELNTKPPAETFKNSLQAALEDGLV